MVASRWELTETEEKILRTLAEKGARTYYDIYRKEKLCSSSTAWKLIKNLEKNGYVEVKKEEKFQFRGRKKKFYGLTLRGLSVALQKRPGWEHIDVIAKQQETLLPLILGKWRHFKEYVDGEKLTDALRDIMLLFFPILELRAKEFGWKESTFVTLVMQEFCSYILKSMPEERIGWLKAIHADVELKQWMLGLRWKYKRLLLAIDLSFSLIQQEEPDWDEALEKLRNLTGASLGDEVKKKD